MAYLRWPLTAFTAVEILCAQIVIVCTWKLLTMVQQDRIFSEDVLRWVRIDVELARRKMSVGEFAEKVGLTPANVAVLKNGRARRSACFSTLEAMCRVLGCQPGDLLEYVED